MEIFRLPSATTAITIQALRAIFARYGLPNSMVSDNASIFTSDQFRKFAKDNGIHLIKTTPHREIDYDSSWPKLKL